jgi:hypothetical protein
MSDDLADLEARIAYHRERAACYGRRARRFAVATAVLSVLGACTAGFDFGAMSGAGAGVAAAVPFLAWACLMAHLARRSWRSENPAETEPAAEPDPEELARLLREWKARG